NRVMRGRIDTAGINPLDCFTGSKSNRAARQRAAIRAIGVIDADGQSRRCCELYEQAFREANQWQRIRSDPAGDLWRRCGPEKRNSRETCQFAAHGALENNVNRALGRDIEPGRVDAFHGLSRSESERTCSQLRAARLESII